MTLTYYEANLKDGTQSSGIPPLRIPAIFVPVGFLDGYQNLFERIEGIIQRIFPVVSGGEVFGRFLVH